VLGGDRLDRREVLRALRLDLHLRGRDGREQQACDNGAAGG